MLYLLLIGVVLAILFVPQLATKHLLKKHSIPRADFPGTGGELARHLIERFQLNGVRVESTEQGDHYDPKTRCVRLSESNFNGRSLTAVTVAAHEVGHAIQHANGSGGLNIRTALAVIASFSSRSAQLAVVAIPFLVGISPGLARIALLVTVFGVVLSTLFHLVTLPVEWDASFNKALPILKAGNYIPEQDMGDAKRILTACALTYVSGSLASVLGLWRWLRYLRLLR